MYLYKYIYIQVYMYTLLTLNHPSKPAVALRLSIRTSPAGDHVDFETMCSKRKKKDIFLLKEKHL